MTLALTVALAIAALPLEGAITTFSLPAATGTYPQSMSPGGSIAGWYLDTNYFVRGFVRGSNGDFVLFDVPGAVGPPPMGTFPLSINKAGLVVGYFTDAQGNRQAFVRANDGSITTFGVSGAAGTVATSINQDGVIAGYFTSAQGGPKHGFLRMPEGVFVTFDVPGAVDTEPQQINASQILSIAATAPDGSTSAFVRTKSGEVVPIRSGQSAQTFPAGINDYATVTGSVQNETGYVGFLWYRGLRQLFQAPGSRYTLPSAINNLGTTAGYYVDPATRTQRGFVRTVDGILSDVAVPNCITVAIDGINDAGQVTGHCTDLSVTPTKVVGFVGIP
ncbi:MAG: hypothetical protein ABI693_31845 [Bryobacteraceae bacterium]